MESHICCDLGPFANGAREDQRTPPEVAGWIERQVELVKKVVVGSELTATIWGYRLGEAQFLACYVGDEYRNGYPVTLNTGDEHDFLDYDPTVPDMVEAMHVASLLARRLGCHVRLGPLAREK